MSAWRGPLLLQSKIFLRQDKKKVYTIKSNEDKEKKSMPLYEFTAPCHFGMEAVLKREIINLGYEIVRVEDGRVTFKGEASAIARANIF